MQIKLQITGKSLKKHIMEKSFDWDELMEMEKQLNFPNN